MKSYEDFYKGVKLVTKKGDKNAIQDIQAEETITSKI